MKHLYSKLLNYLLDYSIKKFNINEIIELQNKLKLIKRIDYQKYPINIEVNSAIENNTRLKSCKKEPEIINWIENMSPKSIFYDIGANIGAYSLVAAKYFNCEIQIYAFEPGFSNYYKLVQNIIRNNCQDCISALPIALSDKTRLNNFNYSSIEPGKALHSLGNCNNSTYGNFQPEYTQLMISYALDKFISDFGLPLPNYLKIDVDGNELDILQGAQNILQHDSLRGVFIEIDEEDIDAPQIINHIEKKGFMFISKHQFKSTSNYNYIYSRQSKLLIS